MKKCPFVRQEILCFYDKFCKHQKIDFEKEEVLCDFEIKDKGDENNGSNNSRDKCS